MTWEILCVVLALPLCVFLTTALIVRLAGAVGAKPSPQSACFLAGGLNALAAIGFVLFRLHQRQASGLELLSGAAYIFIYCFCINFLNWFVYTLTETSMHVHLLVEIAGDHPLELAALQKRYNKQSIIQARIPRLIQLGQLRLEGGRLYLAGSWVLAGATMCRMLRLLLRIPPRPEQEP